MKHATLLVVALVLAARPARAEILGDAEQVARDVAETAIGRVRRAIAIGPSVGYFGGVSADGQPQAGVSFGLSVYSFKLPSVKERILEIARSRVSSRLAELVATGRLRDVKKLPREILEEVKAEVSGELYDRLLERQGLKIVLEGAVLQAPDGFSARALVGYGIGFASLGLHAGLQEYNDRLRLVGGPELSIALTPVGQMRTPVVDLFVRTDVGVSDMGSWVAFVGGARVALDVL